MAYNTISSFLDLAKHFELRYTDNKKLLEEGKSFSFEWEKSAERCTSIMKDAAFRASILSGIGGVGLSFTAIALYCKGYRLLLTVPLFAVGVNICISTIILWRLVSNYSKLNSLVTQALTAYRSNQLPSFGIDQIKELQQINFKNAGSLYPLIFVKTLAVEKLFSTHEFVDKFFFARTYKDAACQALWEKMFVMANSVQENDWNAFYRALGKVAAQLSLKKHENDLSNEIKDALRSDDESVFEKLGYQYLIALDREKVLKFKGLTIDSFKNQNVKPMERPFTWHSQMAQCLNVAKILLDASNKG